METYEPQASYFRVATACPEVNVADIDANFNNITELYLEAGENGAALVVFPELSLTGYSLGDLVQQDALLRHARKSIVDLAAVTENSKTAMVVGLPLQVGNALYNCAAVLAEGDIKGIVPKINLPMYGEFYEKRWYQAWDQPNTTTQIGNEDVPFGCDLLFDIGGVKTGVEICEDLWVLNAPHIELANQGALVIANPSASPELVGKAFYRKDLVRMTTAKTVGAYAYAGCGWTESTMDVVMGGHQIIAENGRILAERKPFGDWPNVLLADIDIDHLQHDRRKDTNFVNKIGAQVVRTTTERPEITPEPVANPYPFLPSHEYPEVRRQRLGSIFEIQAHGLARRMKSEPPRKLHLGLSGGLDSTLALLVAIEAVSEHYGNPADFIRTYTMPGEASSDRTQTNAVKLAGFYDIPNEVIPIDKLSNQMLGALGHDLKTQDVTYENVQARIRTEILLNKANQLGGMVLGTGDLSEIALGWCTYNGDHISHYHVNAGVPKTLVRHLVDYVATSGDRDSQPQATAILQDILNTPVSPELVSSKDREISQKTEDIIGPYELHDFFLYQLVRWGDKPAKIHFLANKAFEGVYSPDEINTWLQLFLTRFTSNQFKRSVMPDGPKVGSVALSPRGDWRMPSDLVNTAVWS